MQVARQMADVGAPRTRGGCAANRRPDGVPLSRIEERGKRPKRCRASLEVHPAHAAHAAHATHAATGAMGSGFSDTMASVVMSRPATDEASCSATRTTLVGSMMPAFTMSTYSPFW